MTRFKQLVLSPDFWVRCFSLLAIIGLLLCAVGFLAPSRRLIVIGLWFITPLFIGGIIVLVAVLPILIVANRKHRK